MKIDTASGNVWITKYALNGGIFECRASMLYDDEIIEIAQGDGPAGTMRFYSKADWHDTHEAAIARAEQMRATEIENLQFRIAALQAMRFDT